MKKEQFENTQIPIVEIFQSISGEGISAGNIVSFVRVAGCDLRCTWCDTKYSFNETGENIRMLTPLQIVEEIKNLNTREIICTGGEPLEEGKDKRLLPAYLASCGFKVRIETNGACKLYQAEELVHFSGVKDKISYCMDIKCPASGMVYQNLLTNIALLKKNDEIKFVVADNTDLQFSFDVIDAYKQQLSENNIAINFSPVFGAIKPVEIVDFLKSRNNYIFENKLWVRLSLQIHKFIWPPHTRGV